ALVKDIDTEGKSSFGTGGIKTKIRAAEIVNNMGINMVLLNGKKKDVIKEAAEGTGKGTLFTE
ncbi:MAG: glutamate 5-kinase, partial [Firmicutes bacterium]|nr:glutamate 5-kinase [Bacillota bacterium]